ncbi:MAG: hypothetical protein E7138_08460 [Rikenellaceae bacterium]|nr:hypothetical protein [Rikenellaceae bacterium]
MKHFFLLFITLSLSLVAQAQEVADTLTEKLMNRAIAVRNFGKSLPQEKVYMHLDNTSYYQGDKIWFQCYVVTAEKNKPTDLSKTLYVELLNPEGIVIEKHTLPIVDGRCHGDFTLVHLPFHSGFYEVRAYTRYMINFGEETIFSRVFPVFDLPEVVGNYTERKMMRMNSIAAEYKVKRTIEKREKSVNVKFYPEGGNLVAGLPSRVAFEATNAGGTPLNIEGKILSAEGVEVTTFKVNHEGRGVFDYTPTVGDKAEVKYGNRTFTYDLPEVKPQGVVMAVDNISSKDSVLVTLHKSPELQLPLVGAATISAGKLYNFAMLDTTQPMPIKYSIAKSELASGVSRIVITDHLGGILTDRLIFNNTGEVADINITSDKPQYEPYEAVKLNFSVNDKEGKPIKTALSVAVRDGDNCMESHSNILTDLLLMSEIKGYVHRPDYYFESDDEAHRKALDELLMVQGWRRYDWNIWAGINPFKLRYTPEQGISVTGTVLNYTSNKPVSNIYLSSMLSLRDDPAATDGDENTKPSDNTHIGIVNVGEDGRFEFAASVVGKWNLVLGVTNDKNKAKSSRILIDRSFSPEPKNYKVSDMQINSDNLPSKNEELPQIVADTTTDNGLINFTEEEAQKLLSERTHQIKEVVVKSDEESAEKRIYNARANAMRYYDIESELSNFEDNGETINDIYQLLTALDDNFFIERSENAIAPKSVTDSEYKHSWYLTYKTKEPLFIMNYQQDHGDIPWWDAIELLAIKSIYISEDEETIMKWCDPHKISQLEATRKYSAVIFIEMHPLGKVPAKPRRGVRKTWIDGYSTPVEFYSPDYSLLPKDEDYRRTLYWNPNVKTDNEGKATIEFYNNSSCKNIDISAETLTKDGALGATTK